MIYAAQMDNSSFTSSNIITAVCTVLAYAFGILCGLLLYHCIHKLFRRKAKDCSTLQVMKSEQCRATDPVYEDVDLQTSRRQISTSNVHFELKENVSYGNF